MKFLAYLFVSAVIALTFVGFVKADGVDDPNFYKDFDYCLETIENNQVSFCRKYDFIGKPDWRKFVYIPDDNLYSEQVKKSINVPEPEQLFLIISGIVVFNLYRSL